jgi:hypothetical protein
MEMIKSADPQEGTQTPANMQARKLDAIKPQRSSNHRSPPTTHARHHPRTHNGKSNSNNHDDNSKDDDTPTNEGTAADAN